MAKVTIHIPSVSWRDGRPRFTPGPETRRRFGIKGQDLKHPDGRWFSAEEALAWVDKMKADLAGARAKARPKAALARARAASIGPSVAALAEAFFVSPVITGGAKGKRITAAKAKATVRYYRQGLKRIEDHDADLYHGPAAALTTPICRALYEAIWEEKGIYSARGAIASLSAVLGWAVRAGKVQLAGNPATGLAMTTPEPRLRSATPAEIRQLVLAADLPVYPTQRKGHHKLVDLPEVGDMVLLGVWTGQRQADRLTMTATHLATGRVMKRQNKTNARVDFPQAPDLLARVELIKARRKGWKVEPVELVANSQTQAPFKYGTDYAHMFARVRAAAAAGIWRDVGGKLHVASNEAEKIIEARADFDDWRLAPMPSVADLRDQDLRDTCVTWLARAGNDPIRIAAITGHSLKTIHDILKHYLEAHPDYGDQAIAALVQWFDAQTG
jgi:integrase